MEIFKAPCMADIWISIYAKEQGIEIWGLPHSSTYFKYQEVPNTIWDDKHLDCEYETKVVNDNFS